MLLAWIDGSFGFDETETSGDIMKRGWLYDTRQSFGHSTRTGLIITLITKYKMIHSDMRCFHAALANVVETSFKGRKDENWLVSMLKQ